MPQFTIKQGGHYHRMPPLSTLPWVGEKAITRTVVFDASCQYDSAAYNADDVNKLFGLSFGFGGVHHNSARFGWRWSKADQCIELLAYVYANGVRNQDEQLRFPVVAQMQPGQRATCLIEYDEHPFGFAVVRFKVKKEGYEQVSAAADMPTGLPGVGLTHGFYFGGELTAPHQMQATISRP